MTEPRHAMHALRTLRCCRCCIGHVSHPVCLSRLGHVCVTVCLVCLLAKYPHKWQNGVNNYYAKTKG